MTRSEAVKAFFVKSVLPVAAALLLYCIFKSACMKGGELDYVWLWILCGLPFGLHRMCLWIVLGGGSLGGGIALFALNFIIGGVIGGFILAWRLIVAVRLQLPDPAADAVDAVLADAGKPLHGVVPVLRQRQHEGQQPLRFQGQRPVPQVVVGHDRVISGLFDAENCHIRRLLSLVLKSVDFGAKKPLSCLPDASHGKTPTPPFKRRSERKKQRFSHPN